MTLYQNDDMMAFVHGECNDGEIISYEKGEKVRSVFGPTHKRHGEIISYEKGKQVRTEFAPTHKRHGEILCFKNREIVSMFYGQHHKSHGRLLFFTDGKIDKIEYNRNHENYGKVEFYKHGCIDRIEGKPSHKMYGELMFYKHGWFHRMEFIPTHKHHGKIIWPLSDNSMEKIRIEYSPSHKNAGQILFPEENKHRVEFASTHENHGEIWFYEEEEFIRRVYNGITIYPETVIMGGINRIEFGPNHKHEGETMFFYESCHMGTVYGPDHIKHGEDCHYIDMNGPFSYKEKCEHILSMREFDEWLDLCDLKFKHELHEEKMAKERLALELKRRRSIAAQRDEKHREQPLPLTERGMPNSGKLKTKTPTPTEVEKIIREVNKNESLSRLYRENIKKHEEAVENSKRVQEQEVALQKANAILYGK